MLCPATHNRKAPPLVLFREEFFLEMYNLKIY